MKRVFRVLLIFIIISGIGYSGDLKRNRVLNIKILDDKIIDLIEKNSYDLALEYKHKATKLVEKIYTKNHKKTAKYYHDLGLLYFRTGIYSFNKINKKDSQPLNYNPLFYMSESSEYLKKSLYIRKKLIPKNRIDLLESYYDLGMLSSSFLSKEERDKSLEYLNEALSLSKELYENDNDISIKIYSEMANEYIRLNQYKDALKFYKNALKIQNKIDKNHSIQRGIIYEGLGNIYKHNKKYKASLYSYEKSLDNFRFFLEDNSPDIIRIYNEIAQINNLTMKYEEAINIYIKLIAINKEIYKDNAYQIVNLYENIASNYLILSKYNEALEYYKKALDLKKEIFGTNNKSIASTYSSIATIYSKQGKYTQALKFMKLDLNITKNMLGDNAKETARGYINIGFMYNYLGDYTKAIDALNKSLKVLENQQDEVTIDLYSAIAETYLYIDKKKGFEYLNKALELSIKIFGVEHLTTARCYANISIENNFLSSNKRLKYLYKAINIFKSNLGEKHPTTVHLYIMLGNLYFELSDIKQADNYLHKALKINKNISNNNSELFDNYKSLAMLYYIKGEYLKSYKYQQLIYKIFIKNKSNLYIYLNNKQKEKYIYKYIDIIDYFLLFSYKYKSTIKNDNKINKNIINQWFNYKGIIIESSNLLTMLEETVNEKTKKNIKNYKELNIALSNLLNDKKKDNTKQIKYTEDEISKLEIKLNESSEKFREFNKLKNISYQDISKTLKEDELYIDFAKTDEYYYIFTLDKLNNITFKQISKYDTKLLEEEIKVVREINHKMTLKNIDKNKLDKEVKHHLARIYYRLNQYINFKSKKNLIISPDGLLNFLPFEALYNKGKYLIESVNISYIPSGRELVRQSRRENKDYAQDIVVFTHPSYNLTDKKEYPQNYELDTKSINRGSKYFKPLKGSLNEAKGIKSLYPKAKIYQDDDATVENLFKIKSPKILHISTHGGFREDINSSNPMQQTFLAFVDANLAPQKKNYKGIATALKLSSLELSNTQLVFLSACETGLGKINQAEGVQGLPKAFIQAGAKNVIMSLWQVNDSSTATLTKYFYKSVKSGKNYKDALREAKLKMIDMHPYYWSAFILSGV